MKAIVLCLLLCFTTISGKAMSFTIQGNIKGLMPGDTLTFERIGFPGFSKEFAFDIIVEDQEVFTYNGTHDHIDYYLMTYKPVADKKFRSDRSGLTMLIEDGIIQLSGVTGQIYYCQLQSSLYNNELLQEVLQFENSLGTERSAFLVLAEEARAVQDTVKLNEYLDKFNSFTIERREDYKKRSLLFEEFYEKYPSSNKTIIDALEKVDFSEVAASKERYEKMNDGAKNSYFGKILKQEIDKLDALQPGKEAPDFQLVGINGEKISLKDCAGSHVLIYHWGLCPGSLMIDNEVAELYRKYKDHLIVIGITDRIEVIRSLYEKSDADYKIMGIEIKPVLADMLAHPWFDVEKTNDNGKIETDYAFGGFPYFVFISPDGKIIARDFHQAFYTAKEKLETEFGK